MIDEREKLNQEAERLVKEMMDRDETTRDVVKAMQSQGRSWAKIANCFRLKVLAVALVLIVVGSAAHAANPPCPPGVNPNALCNQPAATNLQSSDLVQVYEYAQTPGTRAATVQQLLAGYPSAIINGAAPPYNIVGDGVTSNDVGMAAALAACAAKGTTLLLPPGKILLSGAGATTSQLRNCAVIGAGFTAGATISVPSFGTTILLTSTTIKPFIVGTNWSVSGINFYWPNQATGTTVYPPLFSDDGVHQVALFTVHDINIINAYDGFAATPGVDWSGFKVTTSYMWALHDLFRLNTSSDSFSLTNLHLTPGSWDSICGNSCNTAIDAGSAVNSIIHATNSSGGGLEFTMKGFETYAWRYGIKLDASAEIGGSDIDGLWDGTGSIIDSTSGGSYNQQGVMRGYFVCGRLSPYTSSSTSNAPCFNMGANGGLTVQDFYAGQVTGSFIKTLGANVFLRSGGVDTIGQQRDGTDYYLIDATAAATTTNIVMQSIRADGQNADAHSHGVSGGAVNLAYVLLQDSQLFTFNDDVTLASPTTTIVQNMSSGGTNGTSSFTIGTSGTLIYSGNSWDKPPVATVTSCGSGASAVGGLSGAILVGSTVTTTSCSLHLPINTSTTGICTFWSNAGIAITGGPSGTPPVWGLGFGADAHSSVVYYNCGPQ